MLVLQQREKAKSMKCRVVFRNPKETKHRAVCARSLQHEDTLRKAFSRTDTVGLPFLFCASKSLGILTHFPSSLLNPAIFMMQTLECRAAFVGLLQIKGMPSVWHPHLFFQIQVQARMVQTQSLSIM